MAMYYHHQGSSEPNNYRGQIQTLHLMNPNYVTFSNDTQNHHQDSTTMFFNPAIVNTTTADNQFVGFALNSNDDRVDHNTIRRLDNSSTLELLAHHGTRSQTNIAEVVSPPQGLYLISQQSSARNNKISTSEESFQKSNTNYPNGQDLSESTRVYPVQGVILGSKYLKAAQELLDEVASVGNKDSKIFDGLKDKAIIKSVTVKQPSNDEVDQHEVTTAQIQEMQMKKAKLHSMLDEVDQRCRHYHRQMQTTIAWFEREAGMGSSSTYTQLALKTILKQFKRLKSAIISQIRSINKSLGDEHNGSINDPFEGSSSRLKFIDHHQLRQSNAWRPQRGLPETAVSVLRAWLFEHFLHPYPKDSDKTMMAKQTGLTRNQVSNWFINARVRLWKPMVEEMYSEEMKNQEQQVVNDVRSDKEPSSSPPSSPPLDKNIVKQSHHHQRNKNPTSNLIPSPMAEISGSSITTSSPSSLLRPQLFPEKIDNLKRPRNTTEKKNQENSPSSIHSSVEMMELKDQTTMKGYFQGNHHHHPHDYLSTPTMNNSDHHHHHHHHHGNYYGQQGSSEFGYNYGIGELSRFNTEHNQANNGHFSLSLALPPSSGNYGMPSSHRDDSFDFANGADDDGATNDEYGRSSSHTSSVIAANYEELLDLYKRKRYAKTLPPDFVA